MPREASQQPYSTRTTAFPRAARTSSSRNLTPLRTGSASWRFRLPRTAKQAHPWPTGLPIWCGLSCHLTSPPGAEMASLLEVVGGADDRACLLVGQFDLGLTIGRAPHASLCL